MRRCPPYLVVFDTVTLVSRAARRTSRFGRTLLHRRPSVWIAAYVGLLLSAAGLYTAFPPENFVEPNLRREPSTRAEQGKLELAVSNELAKDTGRPPPRVLRPGVFQLVDGGIMVGQIISPGEGALGPLAIEILVKSPERNVEAEGSVRWIVIHTRSRYTFTVNGRRAFVLFKAEPTGPGGVGSSEKEEPPLASVLPPYRFVPLGGNTPREYLRVSYNLAGEPDRFARAEEGDPTASTGLFTRMLYLSASTLTTLGIGDVQPITSAARLLVTSEAILGAVIIGLFLNALARGLALTARTESPVDPPGRRRESRRGLRQKG
jgi:hypothetical protein